MATPNLRIAAAIVMPDSIEQTFWTLQQQHALKPWHNRIPFHVTLVSPFDVAEHETAAEQWQRVARGTRPFQITIKDIGTFTHEAENHGIIFASVVPSEALETLAHETFAAVENLRKPRSRPFVPHVTLADEDTLPVIAEYKKRLAAVPVHAEFVCDRFALLQFDEPNHAWNVVQEFPFTS